MPSPAAPMSLIASRRLSSCFFIACSFLRKRALGCRDGAATEGRPYRVLIVCGRVAGRAGMTPYRDFVPGALDLVRGLAHAPVKALRKRPRLCRLSTGRL